MGEGECARALDDVHAAGVGAVSSPSEGRGLRVRGGILLRPDLGEESDETLSIKREEGHALRARPRVTSHPPKSGDKSPHSTPCPNIVFGSAVTCHRQLCQPRQFSHQKCPNPRHALRARPRVTSHLPKAATSRRTPHHHVRILPSECGDLSTCHRFPQATCRRQLCQSRQFSK